MGITSSTTRNLQKNQYIDPVLVKINYPDENEIFHTVEFTIHAKPVLDDCQLNADNDDTNDSVGEYQDLGLKLKLPSEDFNQFIQLPPDNKNELPCDCNEIRQVAQSNDDPNSVLFVTDKNQNIRFDLNQECLKNNQYADDHHYMNPRETLNLVKNYCKFYDLPIDDSIVEKIEKIQQN